MSILEGIRVHPREFWAGSGYTLARAKSELLLLLVFSTVHGGEGVAAPKRSRVGGESAKVRIGSSADVGATAAAAGRIPPNHHRLHILEAEGCIRAMPNGRFLNSC